MNAKKRDESGQFKSGKGEPSIDYDKEPPAFSLKYLRRKSKYCYSGLIEKEQLAFSSRMFQLSELTWQQIKQAKSHGLGSEVLSQQQITGDEIPSHITPDTKLIALRFHGKAPMVGYRQKEIFYIIWFDRSFTLYNHGS